MIKTIKMKNCATYSSEGAVIEDCQKVNFFYGPNGSGKSTISSFLNNPTEPKYSECEVEWESGTAVDVVVYNRDFRVHNIQESIDGVFTLGQATMDDIKALEELKKQRDDKCEDLTNREKSLREKCEEEKKCSDTFKENVWDKILKRNESDFQEAFAGFRNSKDRFRDEVLKQFQHTTATVENREDLVQRAKTLFTKKPEKCAIMPIITDEIINKIREIESSTIWQKIVVGNKDIPIARLIEALDNADWVNQGRKYIKDDEICPFCQKQTISPEFRNQLDAFFSGEYEHDINVIKDCIGQYHIHTEEMIRYFNSLKTAISTYFAANIDMDKLLPLMKLLEESYSRNMSEMAIKESEPSRVITLTETYETAKAISTLIVDGNKAIIKHNEIVDNYAAEKNTLISNIWAFILIENKDLISEYLKDIANISKAKKGMQDAINKGKEQLGDLDQQIVEAGKNITSVQPTVDEINRSLRSYGFTNFQIVPSPTQKNAYQIQRMDGTLASNTLSEGEETFISFLYFLQFAKGSIDISKVSSRKILVLDDPICSLDSTILYIVSSLVKGLIKDVRDGNSDVEQVFVFTHNVFFHKETSFVDGRMQICNDINYWIISKDKNISTIKAYKKNNPIKTSYELLWQELKNNSSASLVTTQNIMRRILENYFSILGKVIDDTIIDSFTTIEDKMICRSLLSWINDGSHSIPDDLYIDSYTDSIERYKHIFRTIFTSMGHEAHYNMMMGDL